LLATRWVPRHAPGTYWWQGFQWCEEEIKEEAKPEKEQQAEEGFEQQP